MSEDVKDEAATEPDDGGPAFPLSANIDGYVSWGQAGGMSLRDYFAAKAMQGMHACTGFMDTLADNVEGKISTIDAMAGLAYAQADAMLAARLRKD